MGFALSTLNRLIIDDGSTLQNPDPVIYPAPELSAAHTLRGEDVVSGVLGVLTDSWSGYEGTDSYRVHPVITPTFTSANPRPAGPDPISGTVRVASFNVLNYFNGDGLGGGFPTERGASTLSEFARQRAKIITAVLALDADVIGLVEIENDDYGPNSAIQDLVNGINDAAPPGASYAFVDPGFALGSEPIKVAFIYRTETITTVGPATTTMQAPFNAHRPPLAQTFEELGTGERFTAAVIHFKSKGCTDATGADLDQGDGQGCYNATRSQMATVLTDWLATDPTGSGDPDFLITGDLNAYAMEDPIALIEAAGYTDLVESYIGADAYSYVYFGQAGYLDHALANSRLAAQVTGATIWHINADEPRVLDYNEEFESAVQVAGLYHGDAYRSSDHDPVIVGLGLAVDPPHRVYLPLVRRS